MKSLYFRTPFTPVKLFFSDTALLRVDFEVQPETGKEKLNELMRQARLQLEAYSSSADQVLDLPLAPEGTVFQQKVWSVLCRIPPGQVRTYGDIASELGSSPRAVGNACRANPIPLFIPCHRVVAKSGMGGFAGQTRGRQMEIKIALLRHEGVEI